MLCYGRVRVVFGLSLRERGSGALATGAVAR